MRQMRCAAIRNLVISAFRYAGRANVGRAG
jgi:hypothetical protein